MEEDDEMKPITLAKAAVLAGRSPATMSRAARLGTLKAQKVGPRAWITTPADVKAWVATEEYHKTGVKPK